MVPYYIKTHLFGQKYSWNILLMLLGDRMQFLRCARVDHATDRLFSSHVKNIRLGICKMQSFLRPKSETGYGRGGII